MHPFFIGLGIGGLYIGLGELLFRGAPEDVTAPEPEPYGTPGFNRFIRGVMVLAWPLYMFEFKWERFKSYGRNRKAEADHRDPEDGAEAGAANSYSRQGAGQGTGVAITDPYEQIVKSMLGSMQRAKSRQPVPPPLDEPPEVVRESMPILAHRWANLRHDGGRWSLQSFNGRVLHAHGDASCVRAFFRNWKGPPFSFSPGDDAAHKAPGFNCSCGFYAVPADRMPEHYTPGAVELDVELSGRVIEHEEGYRAEHQHVLAWVPSPCVACGKRSTGALMTCGSDAEGDIFSSITFLCDDHRLGAGVGPFTLLIPIGLDEISEQIGVPVRS